LEGCLDQAAPCLSVTFKFDRKPLVGFRGVTAVIAALVTLLRSRLPSKAVFCETPARGPLPGCPGKHRMIGRAEDVQIFSCHFRQQFCF
jgi:hypothetical protein